MKGSIWTTISIAAVASTACSVEPIDREAEVARLDATMDARLKALGFAAGVKLPLAECERIALTNNLAYRTTLLQTQLRDEEVRAALTALLPSTRIEFTERNRNNEPSIKASGGVASFEDQDTQHFTLSSVLPVFDFGATWFAYSIAKDERLQERLAAIRARQTLVRDVRIAFSRLAGRLEDARLLQAEVDANREALRTAQSLEREGLAAGADTSFVEASLAQSELDLTDAQREILLSRSALSRLLSVPAWTDYEIVAPPPASALPEPPSTPAQVKALEQTALRARPEVWSQDLERHIAAARVRQEFAHFFPKLDANLDFDWSSNSRLVNPSFYKLGFTIAHSLLDDMATIWRYRGAQEQEGVESERALLVAMTVLFEVDFRVLELIRAHDGFDARRKLVAAEERLLERVRSGHREGIQSGADVAKALADYHSAQHGLNQTRTEYLVAWYDLEAAVAAGDAPPLEQAEQVGVPPELPSPESRPESAPESRP